ncbi:MAG: hypothetical protein JSV61_13235 [Anaerolineales bacterium]|nr:MAG: hypothetical protein JSV61_13235 [Anaerolineales bacterium]
MDTFKNKASEKHTMKISLLILLALLLSACSSTATPISAQAQTPIAVTATFLPNTPTSIAQTSSQSTYTNSQYGYSLNYPSSYNVIAVSDEHVEIGDKIVINVWSVDPTSPWGDDPIIESTSDIQVSGYPAKLLTGYIGAVGGYVPQQYRKIIVERGGLYFIVTLYALGLHATEGDISQIAQLIPEDVSNFNAMVTTLQIP